MKFISEKTQLLKAINSVINGISSKRDTILEGILIQTLDNSIKFNGIFCRKLKSQREKKAIIFKKKLADKS